MVSKSLVGAVLAVTLIASTAQARAYKQENSDIKSLVSSAAKRHGVPLHLAHGVARIESGYRCSANGGGARGVMQIKSQTARGVGVTGNLNNCHVGIEAGMRYLSMFIRQSAGNLCAAASAYQRGSLGGCSAYGRKVLRGHW